MNTEKLESDLRGARFSEAYHRKHMEYYKEEIELLETAIEKINKEQETIPIQAEVKKSEKKHKRKH